MPLPPTLRNMYVLCSINGFLSAPDYARPVTLKPGIITPREITALAAARAEGSPSAFTGDHPTCSEDKRAFPGAHTPSCAHLKRSYRAAGARGLLGSRTITFHGIPGPVRQAFQLEPQEIKVGRRYPSKQGSGKDHSSITGKRKKLEEDALLNAKRLDGGMSIKLLPLARGCSLRLVPTNKPRHVRSRKYTPFHCRVACLPLTSSGLHSLMRLSRPSPHRPSF